MQDESSQRKLTPKQQHSRDYHLAHRTEILQRHRDYYLAHRTEYLRNKRKWYLAHRTEWNAAQRKWKLAHNYTNYYRVLVSRFYKLTPKNVVHHADQNRSNNSLENLWVFNNQGTHNKYHNWLRRGSIGTPPVQPLWRGSSVPKKLKEEVCKKIRTI